MAPRAPIAVAKLAHLRQRPNLMKLAAPLLSFAVAVSLSLLPACSTFPARAVQPTLTSTSPAPPSPVPSPTATLGPPIVEVIQAASTQSPDAGLDSLHNLATSSGMDFQVADSLDLGQLPAEVKLLIVLDNLPAADLLSAASSRPDMQVVAFASDGLTAGKNLTLLTAPEDVVAQQAFLAGFAAAVVTPDWRVAVLLAASDTQASEPATAFENGGRYFCGLCRPVRPPFEAYPLALQFGPEPGALNGVLDGTGVVTVYVPASPPSPELVSELQSAGLQIIGTVRPDPAWQPNWLGSVMTDPLGAISASWPELTSDQPPTTLTMPVVMQYVNSDLLSPGRLRLVEQTQSKLAQGLIAPLDSP